jgi:type IV secretion system protein TrbG
MKTHLFFILALTIVSAHGEPAVPPKSPVPTPTPAESVVPASSPAQVSAEPTSAPPTVASSSKFSGGLLGGNNPVLTEQEQAGVNITRAWRDRSYATMVGQPGSNSSVQFRYGESLPSIVCAILQVTDIELQPGEVVTHINVGDSTRWSVESALSGSGSDQVEHLIVKPRDIGLLTSLVVTTDRRTYHLLLVSHEKEFMHYVTFLYGDTAPALASATPTPAASPRSVEPDPPARRNHGDGAGKQVRLVAREAVDAGDDSYAVEGKADWKPVQVYSKGGKTYLQMPSSMRHREAPVLFEEKKAGWFHHDKVLVNYRVHGQWYVVDRVLDKATLVSGVGNGQEKVDIRHVEDAKKEKTDGTPK